MNLIERLAQENCSCGHDGLIREAADELERMSAEREKSAEYTCQIAKALERETVKVEALEAKVERLEGAINAAAGALTYYTAVEYDESSDVQAAYGIEVLDELAEALSEDT